MTAKNYFKLLIIIVVYFINRGQSFSQTWTQKANLPATTGAAQYFSANGRGYVIGEYSTVLYEYNPATNLWSTKASFPGTPRRNAVCFAIGNKGYIGTGAQSNDGLLKDFWEYDAVTNNWTQKTDFPGTAREAASGFAIATKGYLGIGYDGNLKSDFWEYNPAANSWTQKTNFGGGVRGDAVGFSIGNKGYIGTGLASLDNAGLKNDFWEYDPVINTWIPKAPIPGPVRTSSVGFFIGTKGYVGTGSGDFNGGGGPFYKDLFEYDPSTNSWTSKPSYPGSGSFNLINFSIGNNGYVGGGESNALFSDFWEFNVPAPLPTITCPGNRTVSAASGQCNAAVNNIAAIVSDGSSYSYSLAGATTGSGNGDVSGMLFNSGVTTVTYALVSSPTIICSFTVTVNSSVVPAVNIQASATSICSGTLTTFTATPTNGGPSPSYQWKLNGSNVGTNSNQFSTTTLSYGDAIIAVLTSSLPCANPSNATSNTISVTVQSMLTFYRDLDGDGFGNPNNSIQGCSAPNGYVTSNTDCNDNNMNVHPGATETCNGVDDDCDGQIDEGVKTTFYRDIDGDNFGDPNNTTQACSAPNGYVTNNSDCNDNNANVHPGVTEICNDIDDDCDGLTDEGCNVIDVGCGNDKVFVCHNGHRICVNPASVPAHLQHGDVLGDCVTSISSKNKTQSELETVINLQLKVTPNPSNNYFTLKFESKLIEQKILLKIYDLHGSLVETRNDLNIGQSFEIGNNYKPGVYIAEIIQGDQRKIMKLVKL